MSRVLDVLKRSWDDAPPLGFTSLTGPEQRLPRNQTNLDFDKLGDVADICSLTSLLNLIRESVRRWNGSRWTIHLKFFALFISSRYPIDCKACSQSFNLSAEVSNPARSRGLKPWPNGETNRRKLKTWVHLPLLLARPCVHLRWLAMTCAHFGRDQICTQVDASFSSFGHPTQVNANWVTSVRCYINLLANERQDMFAAFFVTCVQLRGNLQVRLATKRKTLLKFYLRLLTYDYLQEGGVGGTYGRWSGPLSP